MKSTMTVPTYALAKGIISAINEQYAMSAITYNHYRKCITIAVNGDEFTIKYKRED